MAHLVGAEPAHVTFTASATEAANHVLSPVYRMGKSRVSLGVFSFRDRTSAVRAGGRFAADQVTEIPDARSGVLDLDALSAQLAAHDPADGLPLVAVMLVNNETGIIQPIQAISAVVKKFGGLLVVDAVQAADALLFRSQNSVPIS